MADFPPLPSPPPPVDCPPHLIPPLLLFLEHIASSFPAPLNGFVGELARQVHQIEQHLMLTHPHG